MRQHPALAAAKALFLLTGLLAAGLATVGGPLGAAQSPATTSAPAQSCPQRPPERAPTRVVNGDLASIANWPGFVALRTRLPSQQNELQYFCGGVLIDPSWVVTAAHCIRDAPQIDIRNQNGVWVQAARTLNMGGLVEIVEGAANLLDPLDARVLQPADIIVHPDWKRSDVSNDIALIRLRTPAKGRPMTMSAALAADPGGNNGRQVWVAGFGLTDSNAAMDLLTTRDGRQAYVGSSVLREAPLPAYDQARCASRILELSRDAASGIPAAARISDKQICAGKILPEPRLQDSCSGDSGGPLVRTGGDGCPVLVGLVSYGAANCGQPDSPGVYTRISAYADWIQSHASSALKGAQRVAATSASSEEVVETVNALRHGKGVAHGDLLVEWAPAAAQVGSLRTLKITSRKAAGYVIVADIDAAGALTYLLPNAHAPEPAYIAAGQTIVLPHAGASYRFQTGLPLGPSRTIVIVSPDKSLSERLQLELRSRSAQSRSLDFVPADPAPAQDLFAIADAAISGSSGKPAEAGTWSYGEIAYTVTPKPTPP